MDWRIKRTMKGIRRTFGVVPRRAKALVKADLLEMLVLVNRQKPVERGARPGVVVDRCCRRLAMTFSRRIFTLTLAATGAAACASDAFTQAQLNEKEPQAVALGYVADSARAATKKSPKHDDAQLCNGCALWQSKPTDPKSSRALFSGKQVNARGWCSAWAKKA